MIIPIFIPIRHDDDDEHHYNCMCPDCIKQREWDEMPREYYEERYAVPKKWRIKNQVLKGLRIISMFIGFLIMTISLFFKVSTIYIPISFMLGMIYIVFSYAVFDKIIKEDNQCSEKIRLERKLWSGDKTWDNIIKEANLPKSYVLSKIKENWRYK
jgi:hypothetical protein